MRRMSCSGVDAKCAEIDDALRGLAVRKGAYAFEEGRWLLAARDAKVHIFFGFGSLTEYLERRLGYSARATQERLRVAEALGGLPLLAEALRSGRVAWSSVREITRVVVPETEARWLAAAEGTRPRDVQRMVRGLRPGDGPDARPDPERVPRVVRLELLPEVFARYHEAIDVVRKEIDPHLSEAQALDAILSRALGGPADEGRAPYQIAVTVCDDCGRTWQRGGDEDVEVGDVVREQASCDAQAIGRVDPAGRAHGGASQSAKPRAKQSIPPAMRRSVVRRDGGRCRVPGCTNRLWNDLHHIRPRAEGGAHDPDNVICLCRVHHALAHRGLLIIEGTAQSDLTFRHADGTVYGGAADPRVIAEARAAFQDLRARGVLETPARTMAVRAARNGVDEDVLRGLQSLGFSKPRCRALLNEARAHMGAGAPLGELLKKALQLSRSNGASYAKEPAPPPYRPTTCLRRSTRTFLERKFKTPPVPARPPSEPFDRGHGPRTYRRQWARPVHDRGHGRPT